MVIHQLKINFANLKSEIERNYFAYRDIFYAALIVNLCNYHTTTRNIAETLILEDSQYDYSFRQFLLSCGSIYDLATHPVLSSHPNLVIDIGIYVEEFLDMRHNHAKTNVYSLSIDDCYNVVITNKHLSPIIIKTGEPRNEAL